MSGRPKRGPGRPRLVDTGMSPTRCMPPASPLTPDSEEGFIVNESKSSRSRGRPKGPIKKTRVNAQSKLKSPIRAAHSGPSTERVDDELDIKKEAAYANAVDAMGQPLLQDPNIPSSDEYVPSDKVCSFCCCGPERRMYQGKLHLCAPTPGFNPFKKSGHTRRQNSTPEPLAAEPADTGKEAIDDVPQPQPMVHRRGPGRPPGRGRKKGAVVIGLSFRNNGHSLSPDKCMFGSVREKDVSELFENDGSVYAHHCCASWSEGVCQTDSYDLVNVDKAVFAAMSERCAHCNRYGASVVCQVPRCGKTYHYPCAASAGAFQEIQSMTMLCPDHLDDAGRLGGIEAQCYLCGEAKDFSEMLFCTSCGRHYHGRCLDPAVDITSLVRMSWQCPDCKVCQGCRQPGDDTKMLVCDLCDKGFHTYCLDPPMTTIPKTGWKCVGCRRCEDCGSNTPGGGPTSRWHRHYTVCDSCYQQRNKGLFCQICGRAYRQLSDVAMVQCEACEKWLHAECDNVSEDVYDKINSKRMNYYCPQCKGNGENHAQLNHKDSLSFEDQCMNDDPVMTTSGEEDKRTLTSAAIGRIIPSPMDEDLNLIGLNSNLDELSLRPFGDSLMDPETLPLGTVSKLPLDEEMESVMKPDLDMFESSSGLPDSPPPSDHANEAKAAPIQPFRSLVAITPPKTGGKRKLGPKLKAKTNSTPAKKKAKHGKPGRPPTKLKKQASVLSSPGKENVSGAANAAENTAKEEETEGLHTTLVLFSADDKFTTEQDMCLCCGSFGKGREGQLIACSQCGQSYHPYCVGVKVNKIILDNGWRCLDCTLCEGCGKGSDEARLLLCDGCDISYHTYCLDPPLEKVPQGGWKCKWCVTCYDCDTLSPGKECEWQSNYTQCGPCASKITCPVCNIKYNENDLMIQCLNCDRWLHGSCDKLLTEDEVDKAAEYGYHCLFCRPKTKRALVCLSGTSTSSTTSSSPSTARSLSSFFFTTSGTKPLGPPSPRATALHHYRPQFSLENHPPQPQAKPIHPCQRLTNNGIVEMKLSNHFGRASLAIANQSITENENFLLTDSGLKQMNRLKISAYGRRKVKSKAKMKSKKLGMGNASDVVNKMEVMSPEHEGSKSSEFDENTMVCKGDLDHKPGRAKTTARSGIGGFLVKGRGAGARKFAGRGSKLAGRKKDRQILSMSRGQAVRQQQQTSLEAIMDSSSNEAWPEDSDRLPLQEAYPDWMQEAFFGKSLLQPTSRKKKPKQEPETPTTPSEEDEKGLTEHSKSQGNIQRTGYPGTQGYSFSGVHGDNQLHSRGAPHQNQQEVYNRPDQASTSHSVIGLEGGENWQGSNVEGLPADPLSLSEEFPNPDVLYRSLDMLNEDIPSSVQVGQTVSRGMEQDQSHLSGGSSQPNPGPTTSSVSSSQLQPPARGQQGELDLLSAAIDILPHVDGQEVEDIFADIEMEMKSRDAVYSGIGGPGQSSIPPQVPRSNTEPRVPPPAYQTGHQDLHSFQQGPHPQPLEPGLTHFPHFGQDRENFHGRHDIRNQHALPGQYGYEGEHDFSKKSDVDLASDLPRDPRPPSPRTDPMKQQQKWQEDEKLGETATISPVLYANLEHANLQKEYPDWPNRYRAIARLWRKLTVEQRDPFRLKARDNRVKLKDQGKRAMLEQSKEKKGKPIPIESRRCPSKPDSKTAQPALLNSPQPPRPEAPQVKMENQVASSLNQESNVTGQIQQSIPSHPNTPPYLSPSVAPMAPSQQLYQEMITSTQQSCVTSAPPLTMSGSVSPATPTSFTPTSPMAMFAQPNVDALPGGKGSRNMKGKKTKEDKEKEKEKRKQKLLIQQQQERQWKLLQQKRQLEQQRQQQQQQQETNQMRQEVKRSQQAKGLRALEDKKKKTPQKHSRKQSFSDSLSNVSSVSSENLEHGSTCDTPSQHSPAVSIHSDDSHSLTNAPPRDSSQIDSSLMPETIRERRGSLPNLALSSHGLENMRPLSPLSNSNDVTIRRPRSSSQQLPQGPWDEWRNEIPQQQDQSSPMWWDSTLNTQAQTISDPKPPKYSNPLIARQNSRPQSLDNNYMPPHSASEQPLQEGARHEGLNLYVPQDQQRPSLTTGLPQGPNEVLPPRDHSQGDMGEMQFHPQGMMNDQQMRNMDSQQSLAHKQPDISQWHPEMLQNHSQAGAQEQIGVAQGIPNQPSIMPQNQGQPKLQHPELPRPHPYDFQQNWQHSSSGPNSITLQQAPQVEQAPTQQHVPMQQMAMQPMTSMPNSLQNLSIPHQPIHHAAGMSQVPIQPAPPPPPPPLPPLQQPQHSNLPIARQPPTDEQQQQQQLEMLQKQQREQLMRAQQQQYLQMQMQQQQHLMQQQQPAAMQPAFARPRMNPVVNTKDLPEIDSEEEHQERLRFLYRQRQLQKQQQMQLQAQQSLFQQPWQGPGLMPGLMPPDLSNPQPMPQMAQIRPQPSDIMQQQLVMEYQRRMQQRQELGQQSLQFDKVVQDLQQQQGTQQPVHQPLPPPFLEVSHQRLAVRHPAPAVQSGMGPIAPGQGPGQLPMVGMDGQQLYRMQLQQQQILLQQQQLQQSPRVIAQKQAAQTASAVSKENVPEKENKTAASNQDNAPKESSSNPSGPVVSEDAFQNSNKDDEKESEQLGGDSVTITGKNTQISDNSSEASKSEKVVENIDDKQQIPEAEQNLEDSSANTSSEIALTKDANSPLTKDNSSEENAEASEGKENDGKDESKIKESAKTKEEPNRSVPEGESVMKSTGPPDEKSNTTEESTSQQPGKLSEQIENQSKTEAEGVTGTTCPEKQPTLSQPSLPIQSRAQDVTLTQQIQPLSLPQAPIPNQKQALHQQLVALQQRFIQMQQQRQIMMQQYQQLQQQLQQNQDPIVGGQLMALQQQGQFLQQNLLQVWQQIQMLQQQIQNSSNIQQQPQLLPQPPSSGPVQGQQWPQGPTQEQQNIAQLGLTPPHPGMMNNPVAMHPPLPGQVSSSPSPNPGKPARKQRRSRAKSKDTLAQPQPSVPDWMNPQPMPAKPVKAKGKKGKKQQETAVQDPEIQLQQQRLRQQILHQMEQRHRLLQQQQGSAGGALTHPDISGSPRESGPPTPQTTDGTPGHPMGQSQHPFGSVSSQSNVQQPNDSMSFSGSPSMGIMTPEQINYSTSQLMNNTLAFQMNQPQPNQQPINATAKKTELHPAPVPCSPKPQPMPHTPGPPSEPSSPFLAGRRPDEPPNPHAVPPDESFTQRFPNSDRFLQFTQQKVRLKQPVVQYVADANNPFSDDFQIQKNLKAEKAQHKKGLIKKVIKEEPQTAAVSEVHATDVLLPEKLPDFNASTTVSDVQQTQSSFEDTEPAKIKKGPKTVVSSKNGSKIAVPSNCDSKPERSEHNDDLNKHEVISGNSNEIASEDTVTEGKKGVSSQALQRLESMVADMASEDVCDEQAQGINTSELSYDLFNENDDEEVANLCSVASMDSNMEENHHQTLSLCKSSSQANSVASLECHEEVPSFVSPTQDGDKPDGRDRSQETSPIPQSSDHNPKVFCTPDMDANLSSTSLADKKDASDEPHDAIQDENSSHQEPVTHNSEDAPNSTEATVPNETITVTKTNQTLASSQDIDQQCLTSLSSVPEPCTVSSSIPPVSDVPSSSVASGVLGGHLALPMESTPTEGDMAIFRQYNSSAADVSFSMNQPIQVMTSTESTDHGAMLLSGRDPMLGGVSPMLSSTSSSLSSVSLTKSTTKTRPKAKRGKSDIKTQEMLKEEDLIKKSLQEARRQEYERKKREYEEQQRKKRELQKEMRQQKAKEKEERKRQRILSTSNKIKTKVNHVQKGKKNEAELIASTKESLPLCEPKLILTHALMHPYGTSPFNGQCSLKGSLGRAHIDNNLDYYAKFPSPSLDLVLKVNNQKPLMNGDIDSKDFHKLREATDLPHKKPRYNESKNEVVPGVVVPANGQLLADSSCLNSSSSSPETIQYVASSSPESDAINKPQTPNFAALNEANRNDTESPTFSPVTAVQIKHEQMGSSLLMTSSCSVSMQSSTSASLDLGKAKDHQAEIQRREGPSLGLDQGIDDLDSINVTLTLSPSSEMRVSETVASVAELIGCSPPRPSDIVIEPSWKSSGTITTTAPTSSAGIAYPQPRTVQGLSVLSPKEGDTVQKSPYPFSQFNLTSKATLQKGSDGPYCRHCDVLIIGIGVIRGPDSSAELTSESSSDLPEVKVNESSELDGSNYKIYSINVDASEKRDCFCSELCLKQYYSLLEAGRTRTKMETSESELHSSSCATSGPGNVTTDLRQDDRGSLVAEGLPVTSRVKLRRPSWKEEQLDEEHEIKRRREIKWRRWQAEDFKQKTKQLDLTPKEITELLDKYEAVYKPKDLVDDTRKCILCSDTGDGEPEGPSRLLNLDVDVWVHLNCALWSLEVYETLNGALMNVMSAVQRGHDTECCVCNKTGATVVCNQMNVYNKVRCSKTYHFGCALKIGCMFFKDKTMLCQEHKPSTDTDHRLPSYAVFRKVFINRDEIQQIASMLRHNQESGGDKLQTLRIGSVVVKSLGQLLLHQLQTFHTRSAVYPVGFKTIRYYWSMTDVKKRCQYHCAVEELDGKPSFTIRTNEGQCFRGISPKDSWSQILEPIQFLRKHSGLNLWPSYITGEDLFGLTEQYVLRIIESMPGVDYMQGYNMRYGPSPIMELPLAVNPTGSARSEPHIRSSFKTRTRSIRNTSSSTPSTSRAAAVTSQPASSDDNSSPYLKQFVHSKASQYRKLKSEWKQNVFLGRSNIQGLGLFANRELEPNSMVIEYIGSIIRNEVANRKESIYESQNRGIYMFRIDSDSVIDATMAGAPARYINHSCMPNCVAEVVTFEKEQKIIIISNRKVERGEELTYDYKFDYEDDEHKISCLCGAPNCRKWMN
ncbi:uncharacterized protein LOC116307296 isoform X3 [Actinia tenebrosa]|uniref:Uncharacterized protein LOC116307296 isoform X3 n=1 Tax=Actinia tenebrosa TaxID=6105 RepID=A0A6P8J1D1_ACTTE|nr:uncharacterized protein LOC116307296 isoform X3 [Actinia tenebrosa]